MNINNENMQNSDENIKNSRSFYCLAKQKLQNGELDNAYEYFQKSNSVFGCAYCEFIKGNSTIASDMLESIKESNPMVNWLLCLIGIVQEKMRYAPTYFQIRNFYENDMNMLIKYKNFEFAKKICLNVDYFAQYNIEIYKYTARVLIDNGAFYDSLYFLKKSINLVYKDPEVHFMLAEAYLNIGNIEYAKLEYKKSNDVTNGYFPAQKALDNLQNKNTE